VAVDPAARLARPDHLTDHTPETAPIMATMRLATDDDLVNAPRCPVWRGPASKLRCEKVHHHHLADYPASYLHAARNRSGHWFFWNGGVVR